MTRFDRAGSDARARPLDRRTGLLSAALRRIGRLPHPRNQVLRTRDLTIPMRDGVILVADHYSPATEGDRPTVLMRCPYGRGMQYGMMALRYAEHGYHVLLQSARGTFGSGGVFSPGADEPADGQDTVAWLRTRPWFDGRLVTAGMSYLGYAGWALALDPPPELRAMVVLFAPHDLAIVGASRSRPFPLFDMLMWSDLVAHQEAVGTVRSIWRTARAERRLAATLDLLPIAATALSPLLATGAPWYREWLRHHVDPANVFWEGYRATAALDRVTVPTLLVGGFHDFFVEQTLLQYRALHDRGVDVALTVGQWTHMSSDEAVTIRESIAWLDAHTAAEPGDRPAPRPHPVRVQVSGSDEWRSLAAWPPPTWPSTWYLRPFGALDPARPGTARAGSAAEASTLRYDPADPTPSVGGRTMTPRAGSRDNTTLEARPDVLTFTSPPLLSTVEVMGAPAVELHVSSGSAHFDLFVRLCDVAEDDRSANVTDQIVRVSLLEGPGTITSIRLPLVDIAHRFRAAHRLRLQISGGAHPRYGRNLGTSAHPAFVVSGIRSTQRIHHTAAHPSRLTLPVVDSS